MLKAFSIKLSVKIGARITLIVVLLCAIAFFIGILGLNTSSRINKNLDKIYQKNVLPLEYLGEIKANIRSYQVALYNHILSSEDQLVFLVIWGIGLGIVLGLSLSRSIALPISFTAAHAGTVAQGDFSQKIPPKYLNRKDEVGKLTNALKSMQENLSSLVGNIVENTENLAAVTQQVSASTQQMSAGAQEQSDQIQQVSISIEQVAETAKQVTGKAKDAWEVAHKASDTAQKGETALENVKSGMITINENMKKLNQNSGKIGEIIDVINDIAFQTNLLALNAAIKRPGRVNTGEGLPW